MKFSIIGVTLMMLSGCVSGFSGTRFADTAETKTGDVMPIFIATSRKMNGDGSVTAELSSTTNYLMNLINIPKDHKTGQIRGLLCHSCNLAIAHFKDDPYLLFSAVAYLRKVSN